jgi:hypothetical protein
MIDNLPDLLQAKPAGKDKWKARCPAHADKTPSLTIKRGDNGGWLLHCFGGCDVEEITAAAGIKMTDLFPERPYNKAGQRRPRMHIPAEDCLRALQHEGAILAEAARLLAAGQVLSPEDRARIALCNERVKGIRAELRRAKLWD